MEGGNIYIYIIYIWGGVAPPLYIYYTYIGGPPLYIYIYIYRERERERVYVYTLEERPPTELRV